MYKIFDQLLWEIAKEVTTAAKKHFFFEDLPSLVFEHLIFLYADTVYIIALGVFVYSFAHI